MKLHIVEDNISKAVAATGRAGYETVVLGYLASALAELRRGKITVNGKVTCGCDTTQNCPFIELDRSTDKFYCVQSHQYLQRDAEGYLRPAYGCTWEE